MGICKLKTICYNCRNNTKVVNDSGVYLDVTDETVDGLNSSSEKVINLCPFWKIINLYVHTSQFFHS